MQHSAMDLENYARMYIEDRLRTSEQLRQADALVPGASWMTRVMARMQSWFTPAPQEHRSRSAVAPQPVHLVPVVKKTQPATADPYAGMIVLVRGPKEPCTLDAA